MTRIYEALEQFDLEQSRIEESPLPVPQLSKGQMQLNPELMETLVGLYRTIYTLIPGSTGRVIQFVETGKGTSCSKIIRAFAKVSTSMLKKSVLLLDSDPQMPIDFDFFDQKSRLNWFDRLNNADALSRDSSTDKNLLSVSRLSMESGLVPIDSDPAQSELFMDKLKQTFDLTLIDSWSVSCPARPNLFSEHVDGVLLVVDEGMTRWQIVEQQKRELHAQGANILGVVLNNRTYPIPDYIYYRL